jgi:hypothetical protein
MAKSRSGKSENDKAAAERLAALRDVLDLLRSRVIEDDIDEDQASSILDYLRKELAALDREGQAAGKPQEEDPER